MDNLLSGRDALGNEQHEAAERTRTHRQRMNFRFLAHSLTPFGHETAASVGCKRSENSVNILTEKKKREQGREKA